MMAVLNSHYMANKGVLDEDQMVKAIVDLCKELNIPFDVKVLDEHYEYFQRPKTPITGAQTTCICSEVALDEEDGCACYCECKNERKPPIECNAHNDNEEEDHKFSEVQIYPILMDLLDLAHTKSNELNRSSNEDQSLKNVLKTLKASKKPPRCECGAASCDPSTCELSSTELLKTEVPVEDVPEGEEDEAVIEEQVPEEAVIEEPPQPETKDVGCDCLDQDCTKDKFLAYLEYFEKHISHVKHLRALDTHHQMTTIEPKKIETQDLSVQTSNDHFPATPVRSQVMPKQKQTASFQCGCSLENKAKSTNLRSRPKAEVNRQPSYVHSETEQYLVLKGPIYIPKAPSDKNSEFVTLYSPESCNCGNQTPSKLKNCMSKSQSNVTTSGYASHSSTNRESPRDPFSCACFKGIKMKKCEQSSRYEKSTIKQKELWNPDNYHDYDLTPQKDTFLAETTKPSKCGCSKSNNLLLGNHYNVTTVQDDNNMSYFFPTIATQQMQQDDIQKPKHAMIESDIPEKEEEENGKTKEKFKEMNEQDVLKKLDRITAAASMSDPTIPDDASSLSATSPSEETVENLSKESIENRERNVSIVDVMEVMKDAQSLKKTSTYANRIQSRK
ncbi:PREDICTED: uncharacterized protein LOC108562662 [Nicrophorus vespilloides]|uniref:Uncharacterized protein LOC108562662 n=1 Tax=Nicrophorus vespilloides TaxID=110193 RepID=A0ABM1MPR6_NICVS|nr:PREDICTED: uncharacterized protein LOC108562662 [Nicrophorus vespilloides]